MDISNEDQDKRFEMQRYELKPYEPSALSTQQIRFEDFTPPEEAHLRDYLGVILRRKWAVILFFVSVVAAVTISSFVMRPLYKATAVIRIDKETPNVYTFKDVQGTALPDAEYYVTQYKMLKSRALARMTIDRMGLYNNPLFNPSHGGGSLLASIRGSLAGLIPFLGRGNGAPAQAPAARPNDGEYRSLVDKFIGMLDILPVKKSQLVDVSFISPSPELARLAANAVAHTYIDFNIDRRLDASREAKHVLEKQINVLKAKVENSEAALHDYAQKNQMLIVDDKDDKQNILVQKLTDISGALSASITNRIKAEALDNELRRTGDENPVIMNDPLIQELKKNYASLESEYYNLLRIYKPDFPRMQRIKSQMDAISRRIGRERKNVIRSMDSQYKTDLTREKYLSMEYERQKQGILDYQRKNTQYQILKRDVDANRDLYNSLLQRLKEVSGSATRTTTNIQVLDEAELPETPYKPNKPMNILLAVVFGLGGGVGLAFFMEYFDNTFKNTHEIEKSTNLPTLGMIPMQKLPDATRRPFIAYSRSRSPVAEAFRSIGTFILLSSSSKPPKTILVTSPGEKEGKTTICINTAMALAETMGNGIIIDADLRKPKLHHSFDIENTVGLSTFLSGNIEFEEGLIRKTNINGLSIITSGPLAPNPSELIVSRRMKDLLEALYTIYDFVIIDSAPIMGMPDSLYLSSIVDGSVMVIKAGQTTRQILSETKKIYRNINAKILGVVLNGIKESDLRYNYYSTYYSSYFKEG